jgi:hypothetical protein
VWTPAFAGTPIGFYREYPFVFFVSSW